MWLNLVVGIVGMAAGWVTGRKTAGAPVVPPELSELLEKPVPPAETTEG